MYQIWRVRLSWRKCLGSSSANCNHHMGGGESFADDLNLERGTVSSRVALLLRSAEVKPLLQRFVQQQLNLFSSHRGVSLGQVRFDLGIWTASLVSEVRNLQCVMTMFSSPAYATMLSDGDVLLLGRKAKAFTVHLPVPFCLTACLPSARTLLLTYLMPLSRVSAIPSSSLPGRRGASERPS